MAPSHIAILIPLIVGLAATVATIAIHGVVVHIIIPSLRRDLKRGVLGVRTWVNLAFVAATILLALAGCFFLNAYWEMNDAGMLGFLHKKKETAAPAPAKAPAPAPKAS